MGKKGKGTKKDEKTKKEPASAKAGGSRTDAVKVMEALHGKKSATATAPPPRPAPTPRTAASKKLERTNKGCTESFQWSRGEDAPVLPPIEKCFEAETPAQMITMFGRTRLLRRLQKTIITTFEQLHKGWSEYLRWRCLNDDDAVTDAMGSKTLKDGLSGPLSIVTMILRRQIFKAQTQRDNSMLDELESGKPLHVVVIGATAGYEEKVLRESDYWNELFDLLKGREVRLYLTGPEMSGKDGVFKKDGGGGGQRPKRHVECWKTNAIDFFLQKGRLELFQKEETVVVGLNCGFDAAAFLMMNPPSGKADPTAPSHQVLWGWIPTLHFIAALDLPLMVTGSSKRDAGHLDLVLQHVVGMYRVQPVVGSTTPSESAFPGLGDDPVRANRYCVISQGQQPGIRFPPPDYTPSAEDTRPDILRRIVKARVTTRDWPAHASVRDPREGEGRQRAAPLVPLKRYGNYPPDDASGADAARSRNHDDDEESDSDVPAGAQRGKEAVLPLDVKLRFSSEENKASGNLNIIVEDVFMTDPATARVGVKKKSFALHYFDCKRLRDVVFEAALPSEVDHTTAKVLFRRSDLSLTISVRLMDSEK